MILKLFSYDPEKRPTVEQVFAHEWMNKPGFDYETTRCNLIAEVERRSPPKPQTAQCSPNKLVASPSPNKQARPPVFTRVSNRTTPKGSPAMAAQF